MDYEFTISLKSIIIVVSVISVFGVGFYYGVEVEEKNRFKAHRIIITIFSCTVFVILCGLIVYLIRLAMEA